MKLLLILVLTALLAGCVKTIPDETVPDPSQTPTELIQPDETESSPETAPETVPEPEPETVPETAPETIPESETAPETAPVMPDPIPADTPYTGDIFYFTKLPAKNTAEPQNTYRALAALAFDFSDYPSPIWWISNYSNTIVSYTEHPRIDSVEYLRMQTDGVVSPADESEFTEIKGYTADAKPFAYETAPYQHPETAESGTEYTVFVRLNDASMLRLEFYSYDYDTDFVNDFLLPVLTSCRTWTPEIPLKLRFTTDSTLQSDPAADYHIDLTLPDSWQWNNSSVADDTERMYTGRYSIKRMEFYPVTYTEPFQGYEQLKSMGVPDPITGTTDEGLPYEIYAYDSFSKGERLVITWYFANIAYDGRYISISFLTFEDDPDDYFDTVTLPVVRSVHIETAE